MAVYDFSRKRAARRRILALQLGHLGDFIIALPALRELRRAFPDDFIRLVVGDWNKAAAEQSGVADEVVTYNFFPEVARDWRGEPAQSLETFRAVTAGRYDLALDLRVDEDTRHLLELVDAATCCGIGEPVRLPYLQIILPYGDGMRRTRAPESATTRVLGPQSFNSRMTVRTPFRHETDFSVSNQHLIYGPYMHLPAGKFRATFGLQVSGLRLALRRVRLTLDVCFGGKAIAERILTADEIGGVAGDCVGIEFTNPEEQGACEFRLRAEGRTVFARLRFFGVRLEQLDCRNETRARQASLHIGEQISLLVRLVADRSCALYAPPAAPPRPTGRPLRIVLAPLSGSTLRDWPIGHYGALAKMLVRALDCTVLLVGSAPQRAALESMVRDCGGGVRVVNLAGETAWNDVPDVLLSADLVICNNSGVGHLAASLGVRTLAIFSASHQPQEWGPRGAQARVLMAEIPCSPCGFDTLADCMHGHACMRGLLPEAVFDEVVDWMQRA